MKKLTALIAIVLSSFALAIGISTYTDPIADEKWTKPTVSNLINEPKDAFLALEKEAIVDLIKTTLAVYEQTKTSSEQRITELKNTLLVMIVSMVVILMFTAYVLFEVRNNYRNNTTKQS